MKRNDLVLVLIILCVAGIVYALFFSGSSAGKEAVVSVNGEVVAHLPLSEDTEFSADGAQYHNTVVIENGEAYVSYADCPDQICVNHRQISRDGESIICLPNEVVVTIQNGNSTGSGIDGLAQ